jgi:hypothetical protein
VGTSSARKAPVGKFWRTAKTSASRFASGKEASPPQVQEVVARYCTALESHNPEAGGETTALLPDVVRTAASLGNFYRDWQHFGWEAALNRLGLALATYQAKDEIIPALLDKLAGPGSRLDQAVARAALIDHLESVLLDAKNSARAAVTSGLQCPDGVAGVRNFLGLALFRKLLSDLGEPLEFHAPTVNLGVVRQEEIKSYIQKNLQALVTTATPDDSFSPGQAAAQLKLIITRLAGSHDR